MRALNKCLLNFSFNRFVYILSPHCVKSVQIRSFFRSAFSRIQSEYGKIRTRKNSVFGHFSHSASPCNSDIRQKFPDNLISCDSVYGYFEKFEFTVSFLSFVGCSLCIEIHPDDINVFQHKGQKPSKVEIIYPRGEFRFVSIHFFYFERNPFRRNQVVKPDNV